jgi:hypothetical protein
MVRISSGRNMPHRERRKSASLGSYLVRTSASRHSRRLPARRPASGKDGSYGPRKTHCLRAKSPYFIDFHRKRLNCLKPIRLKFDKIYQSVTAKMGVPQKDLKDLGISEEDFPFSKSSKSIHRGQSLAHPTVGIVSPRRRICKTLSSPVLPSGRSVCLRSDMFQFWSGC